MRPLRTAIVGCGSGQRLHKPVVNAHPGLELAAMCDRDEARLAEATDDEAAYTSVEAMLAAEDLDAVHVCTPPATHVAVAEPILSAGIPVLFEKPAATSTDEVDDLMALSEETGTMVSVVHNRLFAPFVQETLRRVERGEIGDVVNVTMIYMEPRDLTKTDRNSWVFDLPGGELGEGIVHQVYLPLAFVEGLGEIRAVSTQNYRGYDNPIDFDGVSIEACDATGDRLVTIQAIMSSVSKEQLHVHGTEGTFVIDFMKSRTFKTTTSRHGNSLTPTDFLADNLGLAGAATANVVEKVVKQGLDAVRERTSWGTPSPPNLSHYEQIDRFAEAVRTGGPPPVTLQECYDTVGVIEALDATSAQMFGRANEMSGHPNESIRAPEEADD